MEQTPTVDERSRICGIANFAAEFGLNENQLSDGQGNVFDLGALAMRMCRSIGPWHRDGIDLPHHNWFRPLDISQMYEDLRQTVSARGLPSMRSRTQPRATLCLCPNPATTLP